MCVIAGMTLIRMRLLSPLLSLAFPFREPIQQQAEQSRSAVYLGQDCPDLVAGQHDRRLLRLSGPHDSINAVQRPFQHVLVEERQRRQSLVLSCMRPRRRRLPGASETIDVHLGRFAGACRCETQGSRPLQYGGCSVGCAGLLPRSGGASVPADQGMIPVASDDSQRSCS